MQRIVIGALVACLTAAAATALAAPSPKLPPQANFLFWTPAQQAVGYRNMEKIFPTRVVARGPHVSPLPRDPRPFDVAYSWGGRRWNVASFMRANRVSGLIVVQHGRIRLERYGLGRTRADRWTSFSVAKSVTSTLIGAAIRDGYISGVDAPIDRYMPELAHTAYAGVTVGDLLTMRSGVKWNEDYTDPKSDVNRYALLPARADGVDPIEAYMAALPRAHPPGTVFHYDTGETDLAGLLLERATKMHLADYLSRKIWSKMGADSDAAWIVDAAGNEHGGCCLSMTLRDYARFGLFFLHGGDGVLPTGWVKAASTAHVATGDPGVGYGYFWWINPNGTYAAEGVFGQMIYIDPKHDLVAVTNSAWAHADRDADWASLAAFMAAVSRAAN